VGTDTRSLGESSDTNLMCGWKTQWSETQAKKENHKKGTIGLGPKGCRREKKKMGERVIVLFQRDVGDDPRRCTNKKGEGKDDALGREKNKSNT